MEIKFQNDGPESWSAQAVIAPCCEGENLAQKFPDLDIACPWLAIAPALSDFKAEKGEIAVFYGHPDLRLPRVITAGLGKREEVTLDKLRDAIAKAAKHCRKLGLESAILPISLLAGLPGGESRLVQASVYAFFMGLYRFTQLKTKKDDIKPDPKWLGLGLSKANPDLEKATQKGVNQAWAVSLGRDLDNLPGNLLYPESFALRAIDLCQKYVVKCQVFSEAGLQELGAGCILAVGSGSAHPPRLISLEWAPEGHENDKPLVLVGKGITFDSGGLCLKPAANMDQMKCDMSGSAAVLAAILAVAREKIERRVVGILALAENMPDGKAYRPGDVLDCLNGETVEVTNTDAEGRLVLADALAYAQKFFKPEAMIDIATLTGACAVALGTEVAGLFSPSDDLAQQTSASGAANGENFWRLPLWPGYKESLKSEIADIKHTASREGGAITAALFLQNFVDKDIKWAHLDIAGVDWVSKEKPLCPRGASGFGILTLLELCQLS